MRVPVTFYFQQIYKNQLYVVHSCHHFASDAMTFIEIE
jgi:hypothetical protein